MRLRLLVLLAVSLPAGCGSETLAELPPAAGPAGPPAILEEGRTRAVVLPRERMLETFQITTGVRRGRIPVGVGPTRVVSDGHALLYVLDTAGNGLVVVHSRPRLEVTRRVALPGPPESIAIDVTRNRLRVRLRRTGELVELAAGAKPRILHAAP